MPIMAITEALPIIMPNMVRVLRSLLAISMDEAIFKLSTNSIILKMLCLMLVGSQKNAIAVLSVNESQNRFFFQPTDFP